MCGSERECVGGWERDSVYWKVCQGERAGASVRGSEIEYGSESLWEQESVRIRV